jgi:hypothetical protein
MKIVSWLITVSQYMADDDDEKKKSEPKFNRFDVTIPFYLPSDDANTPERIPSYEDWEALHRKLDGWCNKFCFQLEKSDLGYLHWQCRVNLIKRKSLSVVLAQVAPLIGGRWSITSTGVHQNAKSFCYVMKEDTRVDGPWTEEIKLDPPAVMTRQLKDFLKIV